MMGNANLETSLIAIYYPSFIRRVTKGVGECFAFSCAKLCFAMKFPFAVSSGERNAFS